jgi:hypothetical protein
MELHESTIEEMVRQKLDGESYSRIRAELGEQGLSDQEIRQAIRIIDKKVLEAELNQKHLGRSKQWYRAGIFMASLGLILTIGINRRIILEDVPKWIAYAPFFAGIVMMLYARFSRQKPPGSPDPGPGPIRRRRPYK